MLQWMCFQRIFVKISIGTTLLLLYKYQYDHIIREGIAYTLSISIFQISESSQQTASMPGKWSVGLCDCFGDCGTCMQIYFLCSSCVEIFIIMYVNFYNSFSLPTADCLTCWCPCITFGRIAEITDRG
jgi:hypothetical protein